MMINSLPALYRVTIIMLMIVLSLMINHPLSVVAKDFGIVGHNYQVTEQPFIEMIHQRLEKVDMEKEQEKMQKLVKERVAEPVRVAGIGEAEEDRSYYFDPSYEVTEDIVLPCGKVAYPAGTKLNPLDHMDFERRLLFIDGNDMDQVSWLKKALAEANEKHAEKMKERPEENMEDRIILVAGKPLELEQELEEQGIKYKGLKHTVYFDQAGEITKRMKISKVPAIAYQEGKLIRIDQFNLANIRKTKR